LRGKLPKDWNKFLEITEGNFPTRNPKQNRQQLKWHNTITKLLYVGENRQEEEIHTFKKAGA